MGMTEDDSFVELQGVSCAGVTTVMGYRFVGDTTERVYGMRYNDGTGWRDSCARFADLGEARDFVEKLSQEFHHARIPVEKIVREHIDPPIPEGWGRF